MFGGKGPNDFDCSGFTYEVARVAFGRPVLPHGSVNQRSWAVEQNKLVAVDTALHTPGALLFRMNTNPRHVAFSLGNNSTYEARSQTTGIGIFGSADRRVWTHGAVIANRTPTPVPQNGPTVVDLYAIAFDIAQAKKHEPAFRRGDSHYWIKYIQHRINQLDHTRRLEVDGFFGPLTENAIRDLQRWVGLNVTGIVSRPTWDVLYPNIS
jgi:cell wall-associated NlpC family hydrolase